MSGKELNPQAVRLFAGEVYSTFRPFFNAAQPAGELRRVLISRPDNPAGNNHRIFFSMAYDSGYLQNMYEYDVTLDFHRNVVEQFGYPFFALTFEYSNRSPNRPRNFWQSDSQGNPISMESPFIAGDGNSYYVNNTYLVHPVDGRILRLATINMCGEDLVATYPDRYNDAPPEQYPLVFAQPNEQGIVASEVVPVTAGDEIEYIANILKQVKKGEFVRA